MEEEQPKSPGQCASEDPEATKSPKSNEHVDKEVCPETDSKLQAEDKCEEAKETTDWFEPLEDCEDDDDANSFEFSAVGSKDFEEESIAGESERSSVADSDKGKTTNKRPRRKRSNYEEGWEECPSLGEGWKRKETIRQSGTRSGQSDVYYMSPQGDRARSRIELSIMLNRDLSSFEFKSGVFRKNGEQRLTLKRRKRKPREHSSSDSSFVERGEGADTPDSHHRLTPTVSSKPASSSHQAILLTNSPAKPQNKTEITSSPKEVIMKPPDSGVKLPGPTASKPLSFPSINGEFGSDDSILVCYKCGLTFNGTSYDKQRKKPFCPSCWAFKTKEHPMIRLRKWIPCGQCAGCHNKVDCGLCSNCKERSSELRKRLCQKRKCECPIRKGPEGFVKPKPKTDSPPQSTQEIPSDQVFEQHLNSNSSVPENLITPLEFDEDEDASTDDDEDRKRRKRRSCGECSACLCVVDCGTCDFCIDKPKFGGCNKKRQKCRLRQCQKQAARHLLLPSQRGPEGDGLSITGRPRPQYTYSRKRKRGPPPSEDEDDDKNDKNWRSESGTKVSYKQNFQKRTSMQFNNSLYKEQNGGSLREHNYSDDDLDGMESKSPVKFSDGEVEVEENDYPTITQIYSLADEPEEGDAAQDLTKLLNTLRSSALPVLWYAIMAEGPQIQLVQCSKQSVMADTAVQINSDFNYKISVQRQPLLPTHSLYDGHPSLLNSATNVVDLLLDLDKYIVCHGVPPNKTILKKTPVILQRAPTCEFLIKKNETICRNCRALCE